MKGQPRETSQYVATHEDESQMPFHPRDATEEEIQSLPHTVDSIPRAVWIVTIAGAAERFSYYAVSAPWRESDSNPFASHHWANLLQRTTCRMRPTTQIFQALLGWDKALLQILTMHSCSLPISRPYLSRSCPIFGWVNIRLCVSAWGTNPPQALPSPFKGCNLASHSLTNQIADCTYVVPLCSWQLLSRPASITVPVFLD